MDKWQTLQDELSAFADSVFQQSTTVSKLHHLKEEVCELIETPSDESEWADCTIMLLDAAKKQGYSMDDLYRFVQEKHAINKNRTWGVPDKNGVVNHVKAS